MFTAENLNRSLAGLGAEPVNELFGLLEAAHTETGRHYHTDIHIADCLNQFEGVRSLAARPAEVEAAIWFHDAIYDPRRTDNEERSAAWAHSVLTTAGAAVSTIERVAGHILATKTHETADPDAALLLDIDLSILGAQPQEFAAYDAAIRREYHWVADEAYRTGRAQLLRAFLARPYIYQTATFRDQYEAQARHNLNRKLEELRWPRSTGKPE